MTKKSEQEKIPMNVITQKKLQDWLEIISKKVTLVAPVETEGKYVYRKVENSVQIAWNFERTDMSPKTWLLPMTETILLIDQGAKTQLKEPPAPEEIILFGVRPCDARAFKVLDALYVDKAPVDPQFDRHRKALTMIGIACPEMWDSCFCTVVGGAPDSSDGLDILLTKVEDEYAVQILTEKGRRIADSLQAENKDVTLPKPQLKEYLPTLHKTNEWNTLFNETFWKELSDSCISCRVCSFVCPTCRCFDVRDEMTVFMPGSKEFKRLRAWDTCTALTYRRAAGGHNPRDTQEKRLRNRFYCKFVYYPDDFGPMGCVGCGRCIDACPAHIDILEVISKVEQMTEKESAHV